MTERPENALHAWTEPTYGAQQKIATTDTYVAVDSK